MPAISELAREVLPLVDSNLRTSALARRIFTGRLVVLDGEKQVKDADDPECRTRIFPEMSRFVTAVVDNRFIRKVVPRLVDRLMKNDLASGERAEFAEYFVRTIKINGAIKRRRLEAAIIP